MSGQPVSFASLEEAIDYQSVTAAPFGLKTRDDWRELIAPTLQEGRRSLGLPLRPGDRGAVQGGDTTVRRRGRGGHVGLYDRITARTLLVRGAQSDLLTAETAADMAGRGPRPGRWWKIEGVGHAPTFMPADEIAVVRDFLLAGLS